MHPISPRNLLDRAIEAVSPSLARSRYAARAQIEAARSIPESTYRGAISGRFGSAYLSPNVSYRGGTVADRFSQSQLTDRARRVYRENVIGKGLLNTETDNVIAEGFSLKMSTSDPAFNAEAEQRFYSWLDRADVTGKRSSVDWFRDSWRNTRRDGDGAILLGQRGSYPTLQYIARDLIRDPWASTLSAGATKAQFDWRNTFDGVQCDPAGKPILFWVRDVDETGRDLTTPVDARDVVFISHADDDANAVRGTSVYATIFAQLDQIDSYVDAVTKAAIMACIFGLIEKRNKPGSVLDKLGLANNSDGNLQKAITYENGMLKVMGTDETMFQVQAQQPMTQSPDFIRALFRIVCLAFDMPLEIGQKDLSQVNFSGGRIGLIGYYRSCKVKQDFILSHCWNRIVYWWLSKERQRQNLGYADAFVNPFPADYGQFKLSGRKWDYNDPKSEADAVLAEISMGINSQQQACEDRGLDYGELRRQRLEQIEADRRDGLPVVLSISSRDESQKVTAVDADGNPIPGASEGAAPLNGIQITAAMDVLTRVRENTTDATSAAELLARLGIAEDKAAEMVASAIASRSGVSDSDREFQRAVLIKLLDVPQARESVYNATDTGNLILQTGLTPEKDYQAPYAAVIAPAGQLVSGATVRDPDGDIVGGDVENDLPMDAASPDGSVRNAPPEGGDGEETATAPGREAGREGEASMEPMGKTRR